MGSFTRGFCLAWGGKLGYHCPQKPKRKTSPGVGAGGDWGGRLNKNSTL